MRISDWSSDGCSSDLSRSASTTTFGDKHRVMVEHIPVRPCTPSQSIQLEDELDVKMLRHALNFSTARIDGHCPKWEFPMAVSEEHDGNYIRFVRCLHAWIGLGATGTDTTDPNRSEEHKSELQSLQR